MPQLSEAFGLSAMGVASLVGLFYYGYSPFSLVAGAALDRLGPRQVVPIGAAAVGVGALLFATGNSDARERRPAAAGRRRRVRARRRRLHRDARTFPPSRAATLIGATQMFGMAGGSAGQFVVGPLIAGGRAVAARSGSAWASPASSSASLLFAAAARRQAPVDAARRLAAAARARALATVFRNPQSILCGMIAGLLFIPTTIFDMIWGVRFLQEARGFDYGDGGAALGDGAARLDHRLPAARLRLGPDRPAQAGDRRRRRGAARLPRLDPLRPRRRASAVRPRPRRRASPRARRCCPTR